MATDDTRIGVNSSYAENVDRATGNLITGFKWDRRTWSSPGDFNTDTIAPTLYDADFTGLDSAYFQSGYGSKKDLLLIDIVEVIKNNQILWSPVVNHGFFYTENDEFYLFSDGHVSQYAEAANVSAGKEYIDLTYTPKTGIPILVRQYSFNQSEGRYEISKNLRKVIDFSATPEDEFRIDTSVSPFRLWLNGSFVEEVGGAVSSGSDLANLEKVGLSTGEADQLFLTQYAPIDSTSNIEVWTWNNISSPTQWTIISGDTPFTSGSNNEVHIDYDLGKLTFGNYNGSTGDGNIPTTGHRIGITYHKTVGVQYEPSFSTDYITFDYNSSDLNPIASGNSSGFVQVSSSTTDPDSIVLSSTLPKSNSYLISLGNNVGNLLAEVKDITGALLDSQQVTFEILSPIVGTFGGSSTSIESISNNNGVASVVYNAPTTASQQGQASVDVVNDNGDAVITFNGLIDPGDLSKLTLYKIHKEDEALGILDTDLPTHYSDYFSNENIEVDPDGTPASQEFEESYRESRGLPTPTTYTSAEYSIGKKSIMFRTATTANTVHPETGEVASVGSPVYTPLKPDSITDVGTSENPAIEVRYNGIVLEAPGNGDTKAYFAIGDAQTKIRAYVTNSRTGKKIYSNIIEMRVTLPTTISGEYQADLIADIPTTLLQKVIDANTISQATIEALEGTNTELTLLYEKEKEPSELFYDWFIRTRRADTVLLEELGLNGLEAVTVTQEPADIPLGFRLKSTGITVASVLDQVTFLTLNSDLLASDPNYYN